jgi:hypothetical protein
VREEASGEPAAGQCGSRCGGQDPERERTAPRVSRGVGGVTRRGHDTSAARVAVQSQCQNGQEGIVEQHSMRLWGGKHARPTNDPNTGCYLPSASPLCSLVICYEQWLSWFWSLHQYLRRSLVV